MVKTTFKLVKKLGKSSLKAFGVSFADWPKAKIFKMIRIMIRFVQMIQRIMSRIMSRIRAVAKWQNDSDSLESQNV